MVELIQPPKLSPSFQFSQVEINNIRQLWKSLDIMSISATTSQPQTSASNSHVPTKVQPSNMSRRTSFQSLSTSSTNTSGSTLVTSKSNSTAATSASSAGGSHLKKTNLATPIQPSTASASSNSNNPSIQYNLTNLRLFQSRLCTKIMQLEIVSNDDKSQYNSTSKRLELFDLNTMAPLLFKNIESNYQVIQHLQIICIMINCLEYNRLVPETLFNYMAKINSRVYDLDVNGYRVFGEALILTIIEFKSEMFGSTVLFEEQLNFNAFVSEILNYLVQCSLDPRIKPAMSEVQNQKPGKISTLLKGSKSFNENPLNSIRHRREDSVASYTRSNYSETSVKSSRLLLYSPSELDYDTSSLDEEVERFKNIELLQAERRKSKIIDFDDTDNVSETTITEPNINNRMSIYELSSEDFDLEDESYSYLNSFDEQAAAVNASKTLMKKKSKLSFFRKSIVSGKQAFSKRDSVLNPVVTNSSTR